MSTKAVTACRDCVNLLDRGPLAYEKQCRLAPVMHFDPYTGTASQVGFTEISKVNFGECPNFKAAEVAENVHLSAQNQPSLGQARELAVLTPEQQREVSTHTDFAAATVSKAS